METINIIFTSNNNYAQPLGVAIYSLLENFSSSEYKLKINVFDGGISDKNKNKINNIGRKFSTEIEFIKISNEIFKDCKYIGRYTIVAYYRLIAPDILGKEVKKAIYLDCDIMVIGNIVGLYKKDMGDFLLGAVQVRFEDREYYSSGVLLMNIQKMREYKFVKKIFDFIREDARESKESDQDIVNIVCKGKYLRLDSIWNTEIERSENKISPTPIVIHYATPFKPWHRFYHNYYQKDYIRYLKTWPEYKIQWADFRTSIKQIIKYLPFSVPIARKIKIIYQKYCTIYQK